MSLKEIFSSVTQFLRREHIDFAVIGAFALYGYGYARTTKDIDFITRLTDKNKIIRFLESVGFETLHQSDSFSNHLHPIGASRVDLMYVDETTADQVFGATIEKLLFNDIPVPVVSAEHLIAMKLFAAHSNPDRLFKELADIREVVSLTNIDKNKIHKYFIKYEMERYFDEITG
ncbi:MAG: nucleotidyl transferase AbiEii/AbiGii toxin family protein [Chitinispirillaceae bacterium]|nr:nucleotidyl transferase AbiEii/AbiGii toxin family protein [Chitinispirillaceae bacterium]